MIYLYRVFYFLVKNVLRCFKPVLPPALNAWLTLRDTRLSPATNLLGCYWFHASSGEIEYCKSLIRALKERDPSAKVVVSYSSPSAEKLFHNIAAEVTQFFPLPWDEPRHVRHLFRLLRPRFLIFSRTDLWPELIFQARKTRIPMGIVSFNPTFGIFRNFFVKSSLNSMNFISCVDEKTKSRLQKFIQKPGIFSHGDTRFDQVFHRLSDSPKLTIKSSGKVFICGSTWPDDEVILFRAFGELLTQGFQIILSPHEVAPENMTRLQKIITEYGWSHQTLSHEADFTNIRFVKNFLLIDKIGYLADCYRFADVAFVGGSYKRKIHSAMEPLCCGLHVITGPFIANSPEALRYTEFVHVTHNAGEIYGACLRLIEADRSIILSEMLKNKNASGKVIQVIQDRILKISDSEHHTN